MYLQRISQHRTKGKQRLHNHVNRKGGFLTYPIESEPQNGIEEMEQEGRGGRDTDTLTTSPKLCIDGSLGPPVANGFGIFRG